VDFEPTSGAAHGMVFMKKLKSFRKTEIREA
jgi:hypothetical protein